MEEKFHHHCLNLGVAQPGRALALGASCRGFKSLHLDHFITHASEMKTALEQIREGGQIVGIINEDDTYTNISSFLSPIFQCETHERLKHNKFDTPLCWRWSREGFDRYSNRNQRKLTGKEVDLIYDHILHKYGFDPVVCMNSNWYSP